jgi:hypothetical protein
METVKRHLKTYEGEMVSISVVGCMDGIGAGDDVIIVDKLHSNTQDVNGVNYIVLEDELNIEQQIPKVPVSNIERVSNENNDLTLYCKDYDLIISLM